MTAGPDRLRLHTHWTAMAMISLVLLALAVAAGPTACRCSDETQRPPERAGRPRQARTPPRPVRPPGPAGEKADDAGYFETLFASRKTAETTVDMVHMRALWTSLSMHAVSHDGKFPAALKDLGNPVLLKAPGKTGQPYKYVPGQTSSMPKANILVYEERPVHRDGKCMVLRVNGVVELLTPDQLKQAVEKTQEGLQG